MALPPFHEKPGWLKTISSEELRAYMNAIRGSRKDHFEEVPLSDRERLFMRLAREELARRKAVSRASGARRGGKQRSRSSRKNRRR